jgi:type IV pilus assembly protein PilM
MAKSNAVWGIDIGQCALKALRCRPHEKDDHRIVVEAFDYIEYSKILTQPEANREELIREALQQFVSRNDVSGDHVAISVSGQSGLARFIKLPPVERKKIPDIVKYEARQQIPFALEDVVWDYQPLIGTEDEGYALETEVGLFAMKRDQVARALKPLEEAGVDVDIIQLAPLAIYNAICFDRLKVDGPYDPANPPQSTVIISLGTDTTDLVITNGYRVWQRSIPIGGNHFTKALTKELKLTFAKAEHLKRNAMKAENPKAVFQAMRPVFSDLVAEIQRSIGFFTSNNRNAKLGEMIALGNPLKLPGLQRFLSQNLDQDVKLGDQFNHLVGGTATSGPQFKENQLTFAPAYGLCVQALGLSQLRTNLLPEEIVTSRLVRAKKPWAVAAVALLLVGMTINYLSYYSTWKTAARGEYNSTMESQIKASQELTTFKNDLSTTFTALTTQFEDLTKTGENLQSNVDGRLLWLEALKAIDAALPKDERPMDKREETDKDVAGRPELHITTMECEYFTDVSQWYNGVERFYKGRLKKEAAPAGGVPAEGEVAPVDGAADGAAVDGTVPADGAVPPAEEAPPADSAPADTVADETVVDPNADPNAAGAEGGEAGAEGGAEAWRTQPGWVIQMDGYHFVNTDPDKEGAQFIYDTFFKYLEEGTVQLPDGPGGEMINVPIADLGIHHPVIITEFRINDVLHYPEAVDDESGQPMPIRSMAVESGIGPGGAGAAAVEKPPEQWKLRRYDFRIQFCWQPQPRGKRREAAEKKSELVEAGAAGEEATAEATDESTEG